MKSEVKRTATSKRLGNTGLLSPCYTLSLFATKIKSERKKLGNQCSNDQRFQAAESGYRFFIVGKVVKSYVLQYLAQACVC